jgi:hypothetical protein
MAQGHDHNSSSRRRSNRIVLITLAVYVGAALYYTLVYVTRQRAAVTTEALRELASAADQVASRLAAVDTVWQTEAQRAQWQQVKGKEAVRSPVAQSRSQEPERGRNSASSRQPDESSLRQRLARLNSVATPLRFSSLRIKGSDQFACRQENQSVGSPRLDLSDDPVSLLYRAHDLCAHLGVAAIVEETVKSISNDLFEAVGVATLQGDVIFEYPRGSVRTATLSTLFDQLDAGALSAPTPSSSPNRNSDSAGQPSPSKQSSPIRPSGPAGLSRISETHLGQSNYLIFIEPVGWPVAGRMSDSGAPLLLYGIADAEKLWTRSIRLSADTLAFWILIAIALLAYLWAFLKLWVMSAGEGFRPVEAMSFACSLLTAVGLITVLLLYLDLKGADSRPNVDQSGQQSTNLEHLANTIEDHITRELSDALGVVKSFAACDPPQKPADPLRCPPNQRIVNHFWRDPPEVVTAPRTEMYWAPALLDVAQHQLAGYPYPPDVVFWVNKDGIQTVKLCAAENCTFQTDLKPFTWFRRAAANEWMTIDAVDIKFQVDTLYSPNTGLYEAVLLSPQSSSAVQQPSQRAEPSPAPGSAPNQANFVGMAVPLASLIGPTRPPGYGFAVIDQNGTVKFHSNESLNGTSSFLSDWGSDDLFRSNLALSAAGGFTGMYRGEPSHGYLKPLTKVTGLPWFLVTFHSDAGWNVFAFWVLMLTLFSCAILAIPMLLIASLACLHLAKVSRKNDGMRDSIQSCPEIDRETDNSDGAKRPPPQWYWPEVKKQRLYIGIMIGYLVLIVLGLTNRDVSAAFWIPLSAVSVTWASLWFHYARSSATTAQPEDAATSSSKRRKRDWTVAVLYTANATLASIVLVIIPVSIIMRHSFELERVGYLRQAELGLARAIGTHNERIRQRLYTLHDPRASASRSEAPNAYDRHDCPWFNRCGSSASSAQEKENIPGDVSDWLERFFRQITQDPFGATNLRIKKQGIVDGALALNVDGPGQIRVISRLPYWSQVRAAVLPITIVPGIILAVWFVLVRRFTLLRDLPAAWPEYDFKQPTEDLFILSPPFRSEDTKLENSVNVDLSRLVSVPGDASIIILTGLDLALMDDFLREHAIRRIETVVRRPGFELL